jgi:hypothetical protein
MYLPNRNVQNQQNDFYVFNSEKDVDEKECKKIIIAVHIIDGLEKKNIDVPFLRNPSKIYLMIYEKIWEKVFPLISACDYDGDEMRCHQISFDEEIICYPNLYDDSSDNLDDISLYEAPI